MKISKGDGKQIEELKKCSYSQQRNAVSEVMQESESDGECYSHGGSAEFGGAEEGGHRGRAVRIWAPLPSPKGCQLLRRSLSSRPHAGAFLAGRCFYRVLGNHRAPRFWQGDEWRERE